MLPKDYLSISQVNMYLRCPAQYKYRYVDGLILPPSAAMTKGKAVHSGQEYNYRQKIDSREDLKTAEVLEYTAAVFDEQINDTDWLNGESPGKVKDETITLTGLYHEEIAPHIQPVLVEEKMQVTLDEGYDFMGIVDVVDEAGMIRDTKTAGRTPPQGEVDKSLQLTAYSMLYRQTCGQKETGLALDYLVQTKQPKAITLTATRTESDIIRFINLVDAVSKAISAGTYYPNPDNFLCSEKFCGYWKICHQEF